jgi:hypothetical protein
MAINAHAAAIIKPSWWKVKLPAIGNSDDPTTLYQHWNAQLGREQNARRTAQIIQRAIARSI